MTTLDFVAAQRVAQAKLLEQAVHDRGPWSMRIDDVEVGAVRVVTPSQVVFLGFFEAQQWDAGSRTAWLVCRGEEKSYRIVEPVSGEFSFEWRIGPGPSTRESVEV